MIISFDVPITLPGMFDIMRNKPQTHLSNSSAIIINIIYSGIWKICFDDYYYLVKFRDILV